MSEILKEIGAGTNIHLW